MQLMIMKLGSTRGLSTSPGHVRYADKLWVEYRNIDIINEVRRFGET